MRDDELYHYGVKGMKWGVRRRSESISRSKGRVAKAEAKWRAAPKNTTRNSRAYQNYMGKKATHNVKVLKDRSKSKKLNNSELTQLRRSKMTRNAYRAGKASKAALYTAAGAGALWYAGSYSKNINNLNNNTMKYVNRGVSYAAKYGATAYSAAKRGAKSYRSGTYINEAGRRVFARPNFGGNTYVVDRVAGAIGR